MFKEFKRKIKEKLIKFLEIDKLKMRICSIERRLNTLETSYEKQQEQIDSLHRTLEEVVKVGVDVNSMESSRNNSWAVVCFNKGNTPIVKFIDLRDYNPHEMIDFLRRFDSGRHTIDTPMRCIFEDKLFYQWKEDRR